MMASSIRLSRLRTLENRASIHQLRTNFWGIADQILISAANFIVMILLARSLGPQAFGAFVVMYTVLIFANSIQGPMFTLPHNVLGAKRTGFMYAHYTTTTAIAQASFSSSAGMVICVVGVGALAIEYSIGWLLIALAPTCLAWQLQEFIRRVLYTHSDYKGAFLNDGVAYGGQIAGIAPLLILGQLNAMTALVMIAVTNVAGTILGIWQIRFYLTRELNRELCLQELRENWVFGRWLLGSSMTAWVSGQLYPLLTAGFVGVAATGGLRAAQTILGPANIILKSMDAIVPSRASRVYGASGVIGLRDYARRFSLAGGAAMIGFCGSVAVFATPFAELLLGPEYAPFAWLIPVVAVLYILSFLSMVASVLLRSIERTASMFLAYLCSASFALTLGVWGVATFGLQGAVAGMVAHLLILNVILWRDVRKALSR